MASSTDKLSSALAFHRAGQLDLARPLYESVLQSAPDNAQALHLLGLLCVSENKLHAGATLLRRCVAVQPGFTEAHANLGNTLRLMGDIAGAISALSQAATLSPTHAEIHCNLAITLHAAGKINEAITACQQAIILKPSLVEAHNNLGNLLKASGRLTEAIAAYRQALTLQPSYADAHSNLGNTLLAHGDLALAEHHYRAALALQPRHAHYHNQLGCALKAQDNTEAALAAFDEALSLNPSLAEAHTNRGSILQSLNLLQEAETAHRRALALAPRHTEALCNLGNTLVAQNRPHDAITLYQHALIHTPKNPDLHYNLGLAHLLTGNFIAGWLGYEYRWQRSSTPKPRDPGSPRWDGRLDITGQTLLLRHEQGLGDTLQFARYIPLLATRGIRIILEVQPALLRLFHKFPGTTAVISRETPPPTHDWHFPLLSLPYAFATTAPTIPPPVAPASCTAPDLAQRFPSLLASPSRLRVGLAWSGKPYPPNRSIPLLDFATFTENQNAQFFSLQKDLRPTDAAVFPQYPNIHDLGPNLDDFTTTAAILAHLDLVITIDTALAHLAATLGKPTWLLLPFASDWRWQPQTPDNPWYPSARLFRQPQIGDWATPLAQVHRELKVLTSSPASHSAP